MRSFSLECDKAKHSVVTRQAAEMVVRGAKATVVAAVDESPYAEAVFEFVKSLFSGPDKKVVFVYVAAPLDPLISSSYVAEVAEARAKKYVIDKWLERAKEDAPELRCEGHVLVGDPRLQLEEFCSHLKPDALVVGSHSRGAFGRLVLGSVSDYCVHHCPTTVAVVRSESASRKKREEHKRRKAEEKEKKTTANAEEKEMKEAAEAEAEVEAEAKAVGDEGKGKAEAEIEAVAPPVELEKKLGS